MEWIEVVLLIVVGLMVGFINTLAGGGSIISLSILMLLGLPAPLANGTNRVGVIFLTATATASFRRQKILPLKKAILLAIPAIAGSLIGAWIATDVNEAILEKAIGVILLVMLVFILYKPQKFIYGRVKIAEKPLNWKCYLIFFLIGIYGGFLQLGVGYFILMGVVLGAGFDLVKANAIKVFIVLAYAPFTLFVFIYNNLVDWKYGLILAIGSGIGAFIASKLAVSKGVVFVKWVIVVVVLITAADMFGMYDVKSVLAGLLNK